MDLSLDEKLEMLKMQSRDFFEKECPASLVREAEAGDLGYSKKLYSRMAQMGWLGLGIPEEWGGTGGDLVDLTILYEEMGRALVPGPHFISAVVCAQILLLRGSTEQKKSLLPKISGGDLVLTLARHERDAGYSASSVNLPAIPEDHGYLLQGIKLFVPYAHIADYFICLTRTQKGGDARDGITLFLVDAKSAGITCSPLITLAGDKQSEVNFARVKVPAENIIGKLNGGWLSLMEALEKATVVQCAQMVGGAEKALQMAVDYAKSRIQFGRPIGSFQVIQHKCADMAVMVNASRYITYEAACKALEAEPFCPEVPMAKSYVATAYKQVTKEAHQIFAGAGFILDHDLNLYYRRAKTLELDLGDVDYQINEVAQRIGI